MFRKDLIELLRNRALTVSEIARHAGETPAQVANDLEHFLRSLKHTDYRAVLTPARCRQCDFEFESRKLTKPSKCPRCRSTWLAEPRLAIVGKANPPEA